jgi:hypothetical protein
MKFTFLYIRRTHAALLVLFHLTIVLSVLHRFTTSNYPFGISKLFLYKPNGMEMTKMARNKYRISLKNVGDRFLLFLG